MPTGNNVPGKQTLSGTPVYPNITLGQKIENRPLDVQRKKRKQAKSTEKGEKVDTSGKLQIPVNGGKSKKLPELTLKQALFIQYFTDPNSDTVGNRTQSWLKAYGNDSIASAAVQGSRALKDPSIHAWIDEILKESGVDTKARVGALASIIHNTAKPRTRKKQVATKAGPVWCEEEIVPSFQDSLKAIDQLNKLSGDYDRAHNKATLESQDMKDLMRNTFTQDKAKLDRIDRAKDVTPETPEGEAGGRG